MIQTELLGVRTKVQFVDQVQTVTQTALLRVWTTDLFEHPVSARVQTEIVEVTATATRSSTTLSGTIALPFIEEMKVIPDFRRSDNLRFGVSSMYIAFEEIHEAVVRWR